MCGNQCAFSHFCGFRTAMVNVHVQRLFYLSKAFRYIFEMVNRGVLPAIQLRQDKSDLMNLMFFPVKLFPIFV